MEHIDTVFIVGNGFDLNLGLKTSYDNFIKSKLIEDYMKSNPNSLIEHLYQKSEQNWVDIEYELRNYSKRFYDRTKMENDFYAKKEAKQLKSFRSEYKDLCGLLTKYLYEETNDLGKHIDNIQKSNAYKVLGKVCGKDPFYIINFNYTNCIEKIMFADFYDVGAHKPENVIRHIHGSLNSEIVFGIEDGETIHPDHVFLYKSHNRHQNVHGLTAIFNNARQIVFFGYSLGQTDHSYFDDFFKKQSKDGCPKKQLTFYYYNEKAYDNLVVQLSKLTENRLSKLKQFNTVSFISTEEKP